MVVAPLGVGESVALRRKRPAWWEANWDLNSMMAVTVAPAAMGSTGSMVRWWGWPVAGKMAQPVLSLLSMALAAGKSFWAKSAEADLSLTGLSATRILNSVR